VGLTMSELAYNTLIQDKTRTETNHRILQAKYDALVKENERLRHLVAGKQLSELDTAQATETSKFRKLVGEQQEEIEGLKQELARATETRAVVLSPEIGQPIPGKSTARK
jgi:hypothetical protein